MLNAKDARKLVNDHDGYAIQELYKKQLAIAQEQIISAANAGYLYTQMDSCNPKISQLLKDKLQEVGYDVRITHSGHLNIDWEEDDGREDR